MAFLRQEADGAPFIEYGRKLVALRAGIASFSVKAPLRVVGVRTPLGTFLPQFFMPRFRVSYIDLTIRERFVDAPTAGDAEDIVYEEISESVHHHLVEAWIDDFSASEVSAKEAEKTRCSLCSCQPVLFPIPLFIMGAMKEVFASLENTSSALQTQEIAFDHPDSRCMFDTRFVATPAALELHGADVIVHCLAELQKLADERHGLDYLQVFRLPTGPLWIMYSAAKPELRFPCFRQQRISDLLNEPGCQPAPHSCIDMIFWGLRKRFLDHARRRLKSTLRRHENGTISRHHAEPLLERSHARCHRNQRNPLNCSLFPVHLTVSDRYRNPATEPVMKGF